MIKFLKTFDVNDAKLVTRVVVFLLAWVNQILANYGKSPINISSEEISVMITHAITLVTSMYMLWKNNNFTSKARGK